MISVAHSVAEACAFRPEARRLASICSAEALHVVGRKIHVLRTVCNFFTRVTTTLPPRRTFTGQQWFSNSNPQGFADDFFFGKP